MRFSEIIAESGAGNEELRFDDDEEKRYIGWLLAFNTLRYDKYDVDFPDWSKAFDHYTDGDTPAEAFAAWEKAEMRGGL